jgi:hypothetical protein
MAKKFMNAELEAIRNNLKCAYCDKTFIGSNSQAWKVKYEKRRVYCSDECRRCGNGNGRKKPDLISCGPCLTCEKPFLSRAKKPFCSLACYLKRGKGTTTRKPSSESAESREQRAARLRTGKYVKCLDCGAQIYEKPSRPRRFCNQICYRSYMASRFDRHVGNPATIEVMQAYDEFLDQDELSCIVDGCEWHGRHLSLHVNFAHGITAEDFKKLAGFNLSSGIIAKPTAELYSARALTGVALATYDAAEHLEELRSLAQKPRNYYSREASEHMMKARALAADTPGPDRVCRGCGVTFQQSTPMGKALYCKKECRDSHYALLRKVPNPKKRIQDEHGKFVWVDSSRTENVLTPDMETSEKFSFGIQEV